VLGKFLALAEAEQKNLFPAILVYPKSAMSADIMDDQPALKKQRISSAASKQHTNFSDLKFFSKNDPYRGNFM
jgi:hypothetical protein